MTDTQRENRRWDNLSLALMWNGIAFIFDFDLVEGWTGKR